MKTNNGDMPALSEGLRMQVVGRAKRIKNGSVDILLHFPTSSDVSCKQAMGRANRTKPETGENVIGSPYFLLTLVLGAGIWAAVVWVVV